MNQQLTYGLDTKTKTIKDGEWFWQEVYLRAANNYGAWTNHIEAENRIVTAIYDICRDAKMSDTYAMQIQWSSTNEIVETAKQMEYGY